MSERTKRSARWTRPYRNAGRITSQRSGIDNGDRGVFVTCDRGRDTKCIYELRDLLGEWISSQSTVDSELARGRVSDHASEEEDLEASIAQELDDLKPSTETPQSNFNHIKLDTPCVNFIRLAKHLDPVQIVHDICYEAYSSPERKRTRFIMRMTPMTMMKKTLPSGLEDLCEKVLWPHFRSGGPTKKFAIRPTIWENTSLDRDRIIQLVADAITKSEKHTVDLKNYDVLVLVNVYRNVCGMSVVGADYKDLKGYNLTELYQPWLSPSAKNTKGSDQGVQKQTIRYDDEGSRRP